MSNPDNWPRFKEEAETIGRYLAFGSKSARNNHQEFLGSIRSLRDKGVSKFIAEFIRYPERDEFENMPGLAVQALECRGDDEAIEALTERLGHNWLHLDEKIVASLLSITSAESSKRDYVVERLRLVSAKPGQRAGAVCWASYALLLMSASCNKDLVLNALVNKAGDELAKLNPDVGKLLREYIGLHDDVWEATCQAFGSGQTYVANSNFIADYHPDSYHGELVASEHEPLKAVRWLCNSSKPHVEYILQRISEMEKHPERASIARDFLSVR